MNGVEGCRDIRQALGVYVLGAIDPAERALVDTHLATCPGCREELAGLAGMPALLRRVPPPEAERLAAHERAADMADEVPPGGVLAGVLARTVRARRARRWREVAAGAAVAVLALVTGVAGAGAVHAAANASAPRAVLDSWHTVSGGGSRSGVGVTVKYAGTAWGTTMAVKVTGLQPGTACQFQVTDAAGHTTVLGRWRVNYRSATTWYPVATSVTARGVRSFQVTSGGHVVASVPVR